MVGYLLLTGNAGLDRLDAWTFKNKSASWEDVHGMAMTLELLWNNQFGQKIPKARLLQSMRLLLDCPRQADRGVTILADWKDWDSQERIVGMYDRQGPERQVLNEAIIAYLLDSIRLNRSSIQRHKAAEKYLEQLRAKRSKDGWRHRAHSATRTSCSLRLSFSGRARLHTPRSKLRLGGPPRWIAPPQINGLLKLKSCHQLTVRFTSTITRRRPSIRGVLEAMLPYFGEKFGNAASVNHVYGWEAADAVESARAKNRRAFASGRPQSGFYERRDRGQQPGHQRRGAGGAFAEPCDHHGRGTSIGARSVTPSRTARNRGDVSERRLRCAVAPDDIARAIRPNTVLISVIWANNEVGSLNPIREIGELCRERGILFHTDAVQAIGKLPVDLSTLAVDLVSGRRIRSMGRRGWACSIFAAAGPGSRSSRSSTEGGTNSACGAGRCRCL